MEAARIKKLDNAQLQRFDHDLVPDAFFDTITERIDRDFPAGRFSFLDIAGGTGMFANRILDRYPQAVGTLVDNSQQMLDYNAQHPRKSLILSSAEDLDRWTRGQRYDIIFLNFALHHFIVDSYSGTRAMQRKILAMSGGMLAPNGRVSIMEHMCNGALHQNWPSFVIFQLTSSKRLAKLMRRLGANTAGVGVCFLDHRQWCLEIARASLRVEHYHEAEHRLSRLHQTALLIRSYRTGHFWVGQERAAAK